MSPVERWRRYDDRYSVSTMGQVKDHKRNKICKQWIDRDELWAVTIHGRPRRTAMIVAAVWLGRKPGEHVYYRKGIDCNVKNLTVAKPRGRRRWNARLTATKARAVARSNLSLAELAAKHRVSVTCIQQVRNGVTWGWATGIKRTATKQSRPPSRTPVRNRNSIGR
jgi:hypothetical protein